MERTGISGLGHCHRKEFGSDGLALQLTCGASRSLEMGPLPFAYAACNFAQRFGIAARFHRRQSLLGKLRFIISINQ